MCESCFYVCLHQRNVLLHIPEMSSGTDVSYFICCRWGASCASFFGGGGLSLAREFRCRVFSRAIEARGAMSLWVCMQQSTECNRRSFSKNRVLSWLVQCSGRKGKRGCVFHTMVPLMHSVLFTWRADRCIERSDDELRIPRRLSVAFTVFAVRTTWYVFFRGGVSVVRYKV